MEDNRTIDNTDNGTNNNTDNGTPQETKSLPTGDSPNKSLDDGGESSKTLEEGEDPHKTLPTRDHETKKINESSHENKANDEAYEEPKEEVKADLFNLDYFDKPEEAPQEVTEKASELINGDLNYFDNWITEAEDQKKQNKEQLDAYLKSNVESGNQLAYTQEDLNEAQQSLQEALSTFNEENLNSGYSVGPGSPIPYPISFVASEVSRASNENRNTTSKEEALQKIREQHPIIASNISDEMLNAWADSIVNYNKQKQIQEDLGRNGPTVNRGMSKAEEMDLMNRAASDYSSLSDAEKEMVGKVVDAVAANPNALNQLPEPAMPFETPRDRRAREERNRAREESNQRLRENVSAVNEAREAERVRETPTRTEPERPAEPTRTPEPVRTETVPPRTSTPETPRRETLAAEPEEETESESTATETPTTEEPEEETESTESESTETPTEETTETTLSDEEIIAKADEAKATYEEAKRKEYEAIRGEADETTIAQLAAEAERWRQEWEKAEEEAAALRPREEGEEDSEEQTVKHGREDRELSKEETLPEWVGGDDPHTSSAGAYWAGAFGDENWSDKVPQKTAQGLIDYANDHHDNPIAMFGMTALMEAGGYDALKAGRDVMDMIEAAKGVASDTSNAIDFFKNGSVLDGIKSILSAGWNVLKVLGNALSSAWHACKSVFSFIRSVFAPVSSAISSLLKTVNGYNSVKAMIRDMFGIENTDEVINEIFGDNSETATEQKPVNVLNKTGFSVKGGTVTDESDYNNGLKEKENEIASDVCKKTMLYFPYLRRAFR